MKRIKDSLEATEILNIYNIHSFTEFIVGILELNACDVIKKFPEY